MPDALDAGVRITGVAQPGGPRRRNRMADNVGLGRDRGPADVS